MIPAPAINRLAESLVEEETGFPTVPCVCFLPSDVFVLYHRIWGLKVIKRCHRHVTASQNDNHCSVLPTCINEEGRERAEKEEEKGKGGRKRDRGKGPAK